MRASPPPSAASSALGGHLLDALAPHRERHLETAPRQTVLLRLHAFDRFREHPEQPLIGGEAGEELVDEFGIAAVGLEPGHDA